MPGDLPGISLQPYPGNRFYSFTGPSSPQTNSGHRCVESGMPHGPVLRRYFFVAVAVSSIVATELELLSVAGPAGVEA
jgi:hypothetical protein